MPSTGTRSSPASTAAARGAMRPRTRPRRAEPASAGRRPADDPTRGRARPSSAARDGREPEELGPTKPSRRRASRRGIRTTDARPRAAEGVAAVRLPRSCLVVVRRRSSRRAFFFLQGPIQRAASSGSAAERLRGHRQRARSIVMIHEGDIGSDIAQNAADERRHERLRRLLRPAAGSRPRRRVPARRLPARRADERAGRARRAAGPGEPAREHRRHPRGHRRCRRARS